MSRTLHTKVLILGSGPAGYTAAIYAARANLSPVVIKGLQPGGQLTITTDVENYPGYGQPVQGPWMMEQMAEQAARVGAELVDDSAVNADLSRRPFRVIGDSGTEYFGDTLLICTGASARWLGLDSEQRFMGHGVSACATCDGFFFRNKVVAVVGGGNTAVEEALFLTKFATRVYLIHRRDRLRAEKILQDRMFANLQIEVVWDHVVSEIVGQEQPPTVTGVRIQHVVTGESRDLPVDGVFVAIGHTPNTALFRDALHLDPDGYISTHADSTATNVAGVFAAGDVQDKVFRQAVTAAGTGCMAALEAERYLAEHER